MTANLFGKRLAQSVVPKTAKMLLLGFLRLAGFLDFSFSQIFPRLKFNNRKKVSN
jgi:hypothetical protein